MKIRTSFVSNSSSSSFVIAGVLLDRDDRSEIEILNQFLPLTLNQIADKMYGKPWKECDEFEQSNISENEDMPLRVLNCEDYGAPKGKTVVGIPIVAASHDGLLDDKDLKLSDILEQLKWCGIISIDVHIMSGTRQC